jgi:hypothetical protein
MAVFRVQSMTTAKPYGAATSRAARIIPGNSALTTATTARSSRCDHDHYFIAQTLAHDEPSQFATNSLANGRGAMIAGYRIGKN